MSNSQLLHCVSQFIFMNFSSVIRMYEFLVGCFMLLYIGSSYSNGSHFEDEKIMFQMYINLFKNNKFQHFIVIVIHTRN